MLDHQTAEDVAVNRPERIAAVRGLEPEEPAAGRRDADRAPAVVGVSHRDQAGGDSRGRSTARAPGRPAGVPGIARGAEESRLGRRKNPELGRIGLADHDEAGAPQASRQLAVGFRCVVAVQERGALGEPDARVFGE